MIDTAHTPILPLINRYLLASFGVELKKSASSKGDQWNGPCPRCKRLTGEGGKDRLSVYPNRVKHEGNNTLFWCNQCFRDDEPSKHWSGDSITFVMGARGCSFNDACQELGIEIASNYSKTTSTSVTRLKPIEIAQSPNQQWQTRGNALVIQAQQALYQPEGATALNYLHNRGITDHAIKWAKIGYNPQTSYDHASAWGLEDNKKVCIPSGIVIPWYIDNQLWSMNIRLNEVEGKHFQAREDAKYWMIKGSSNGLYNADAIQKDKPLIIVESELDALLIMIYAGDVVNVVATGGIDRGRADNWILKIQKASPVIFAFDNDSAGDSAYTSFWENKFPHALRRRPTSKDITDMYKAHDDIRQWVENGLKLASYQIHPLQRYMGKKIYYVDGYKTTFDIACIGSIHAPSILRLENKVCEPIPAIEQNGLGAEYCPHCVENWHCVDNQRPLVYRCVMCQQTTRHCNCRELQKWA